MNRIFVRSSTTPLLIDCHQSRLAKVPIDIAGEPASLGTALHRFAADYCKTGKPGNIEAICESEGIPYTSEVDYLCGSIIVAWREMKTKHPNPMIEKELKAPIYQDDETEIWLTGHGDVISQISHDTVRILDWKSGRLKTDFIAQLESYGLLATALYGAENATGTVVWLRDREWETKRLDADRLAYVKQRIIDAVLSPGGFNVGDHCVFCPRFSECEARQNLGNAAMGQIVPELQPTGLATIEPFDLSRLRAGMRIVEKCVAHAKLMIKQELEKNGPKKLPMGKLLVLDDREKRELLPAKAWPILSSILSANQMADITSLTIGKVETAVKSRAIRGQKHKAWQNVLSELEEAGAIKKNAYRPMAEIVDPGHEIDPQTKGDT